mmetsp:Transcript_93744/g.264676  ORF Transcript_93744/g.264676 Transcript_93744/m.264676 type:complete len:199 (-) Transcript_93744:111-707(-)
MLAMLRFIGRAVAVAIASGFLRHCWAHPTLEPQTVFSPCDAQADVPNTCPEYWPTLPSSGWRECRWSKTTCPSPPVDPVLQYREQAGFMVQTWPRLVASAGQNLVLTCGHSVGCSTDSAGYVALECTAGESLGVHDAVAGVSTASESLVKRGDPPEDFWLPFDGSQLSSGTAHRVCIDLDGASPEYAFSDIGIVLNIG